MVLFKSSAERTMAKRQIKLHTSLILLLFSASALTFLLVGTVILSVRLPVIENNQRTRIQEQAVLTSRLLDHVTNHIESELQPLARLLVQQKPVELQPYLTAVVGDSEIFDAAYIVAENGRVEALGLSPRLQHAQAELRGADFSGNHLFQSALKMRQSASKRSLVWSDKYLSVLAGKHTAGVAILAGKHIVIGEISLERILNVLKDVNVNDEHTVTIIDSLGQWLASNKSVGDAMRYSNFSQLVAYRSIISEYALPDYEEINGERLLVGGTVSEKLGWVFLTTMPSGMSIPAYRVTVQLVFLGFLAAVVFGLVMATLWSIPMTRILERLIQRTHKVTQGDFSSPWPETGRISELNQLGRDLAHMVTSIRSREDALRRSEERLRATLETTPSIAIQWFDRRGRVLYWNKASELMYGFTADEAVGHSVTETPLIYVDAVQAASFIDVMQAIERSGESFGPVDFPLRHKNGQEVIVLATTFQIPGEDGQPIFVCMDIDVTEQRRVEREIRVLNMELEDRVEQRTRDLTKLNDSLKKTLADLTLAQNQLVQSEKLAALGNLVAGVSHELNTPIGNGLMAISTLADRTREFDQSRASGLRRSEFEDFMEQVHAATDIATRNLQRAAELIASFKQVAVDQTSAQRREFALLEVAEEIVVTLMPSLKRTPYKVEIDVPEILRLDSYPGALGQTIANLINNAVSHGFDGRDHGIVRIEGAALDAGHVRLVVRDDGCGIPESLHKRIFEPFYTTRMGRGGSGLGLHITHNAVTSILGGTVRVKSAPGMGTAFEIDLPVVAPQPKSS